VSSENPALSAVEWAQCPPKPGFPHFSVHGPPLRESNLVSRPMRLRQAAMSTPAANEGRDLSQKKHRARHTVCTVSHHSLEICDHSLLIPVVTPPEEITSQGWEKTAESAMNSERAIERLRTAIATGASRPADVADGKFDATTKRGALKLLRTVVSAEKHVNTAA